MGRTKRDVCFAKGHGSEGIRPAEWQDCACVCVESSTFFDSTVLYLFLFEIMSGQFRLPNHYHQPAGSSPGVKTRSVTMTVRYFFSISSHFFETLRNKLCSMETPPKMAAIFLAELVYIAGKQ